jgi:hypothetical protein
MPSVSKAWNLSTTGAIERHSGAENLGSDSEIFEQGSLKVGLMARKTATFGLESDTNVNNNRCNRGGLIKLEKFMVFMTRLVNRAYL